MSKRDRIVILGWYGSANTGDEAVLEAVVFALRARGFRNLHVLSTDPKATAATHGVTSSRRRPDLQTLRAMMGARGLVLGGGGLIQDGTSVYNLPLYALFVCLARLFGLKVVGWGLGVEPIWTLLGKLLARYIVRSSDHFSVRDRESFSLLRQAEVHTETVVVTADPAFMIPVPLHDHSDDEGPHVIFCLRDLSDNRPGINPHYLLPVSVRKRLGIGWRPSPERTDALVKAAANGIAYCVNQLGARVTLLALWPGRDDAILTQIRQASLALGVSPAALDVESRSHGPGKVARIIAGADLLVSMRLHALIFAARAGVPMVALSYARKMGGLMRTLGQDRWLIEVDRTMPRPDEVVSKLTALRDRSGDTSSALRRAAELARLEAERDADAICALLGVTSLYPGRDD